MPVDSSRLRLLRLPFLLVLLAATALGGCATLPTSAPISEADLAWTLSGADRLPAGDGDTALEAPKALLYVSEPMRRFAEAATRDAIGPGARMTALAKALGAPDGLHLQYDADATLTAEQVFTQRRANCLSYTLLFVALARELGVNAHFNDVDIPPVWDVDDGSTLLLYKHINARIVLTRVFYQIVDISGDEYDPGYPQREISDIEAQAQFYNNRAGDLRRQQHYADALRYELRALNLAPDHVYLWANLAGLYLQMDSSRAARIAATQALTLAPNDMLANDIASQVYQQLGQRELAAEFHRRALRQLDGSAYYHYQLALRAIGDGDEAKAYEHVHRAIALYPKDPRFFLLAAVLLQRNGQTRLAGDCLQTALALSPDAARQARYRSKFARLAGNSS